MFALTVPLPLCPLLCSLLCTLPCALALPAHAAAVRVTVSDAAGRPLQDAVVMLEPVSGSLPVKPMATVDIAQDKRQFTPALTVITVGTAVRFPNFDTVRHHVYSFAPIKTFELKLYAGVPHIPVVFDKPGSAVLGCNIHDRMSAWIVVVDTPLYGRTQAGGELRLDDIPAGKYRLRTWHASLPVGQEPLSQPLTVSASEGRVNVQLPGVMP